MDETTSAISRPPTPGELFRDRCFRATTVAFAWLVILVVILIVVQIGAVAMPAIEKYGVEPLTSAKWDGKNNFGFLPEIWGTIYSSVLGVGIGALFGVAVAIF